MHLQTKPITALLIAARVRTRGGGGPCVMPRRAGGLGLRARGCRGSAVTGDVKVHGELSASRDCGGARGAGGAAAAPRVVGIGGVRRLRVAETAAGQRGLHRARGRRGVGVPGARGIYEPAAWAEFLRCRRRC